MLFKFKKIESPLCYFCENVIETIEHFLFLCPRVQVFWNEVCSTFGEKLKWSRSLHIKDIFFGSQDLKILNTLTNYIILESKYFLYRCKLNKTPLSILHLIEKIKNTYYIERSIARENNKIGYHYEKWGPLLPLISPWLVVVNFFLNYTADYMSHCCNIPKLLAFVNPVICNL